jgi:hypothetical protein
LVGCRSGIRPGGEVPPPVTLRPREEEKRRCHVIGCQEASRAGGIEEGAIPKIDRFQIADPKGNSASGVKAKITEK